VPENRHCLECTKIELVPQLNSPFKMQGGTFEITEQFAVRECLAVLKGWRAQASCKVVWIDNSNDPNQRIL